MDELDTGGEVDVPRAAAGVRVAAQPGRGQGQQRPQPLAAGRHDMRGELRDQRDRAVHPRDDGSIAGLEIVADQIDQRGERVFAVERR